MLRRTPIYSNMFSGLSSFETKPCSLYSSLDTGKLERSEGAPTLQWHIAQTQVRIILNYYSTHNLWSLKMKFNIQFTMQISQITNCGACTSNPSVKMPHKFVSPSPFNWCSDCSNLEFISK